MIIAVAGTPGVGKTRWISEQIKNKPSRYLSPGTGKVPIDQTNILTVFPKLEVITPSIKLDKARHLNHR